jgi:membrane protein
MQDHSPLAPEERRKQLASLEAAFGHEVAEKFKRPRHPAFEVIKRVAAGVYNEGFIHAGNLAFLALLALFPFFILATALATLLGETESGALTVSTILAQLPPGVARTLRGPIFEALDARTGPLLWFGGLVGLWTAGSFIETIRDIIRRAYGVKYSAPFWEYRLASIALILGSVILLMFAFAVTLVLRSVQTAVEAWFPFADDVATELAYFRVVPGLTLFATFYILFLALTPSRYRKRGCLKWPGALAISLWWLATVEVLPWAISAFGGYDLTYGSLAGVMIVLIFFFMVGLGVVMGAELNAALAEASPTALKGEIYSGPYKDQLEVEEPQPGEDVELVPQQGGPQL